MTRFFAIIRVTLLQLIGSKIFRIFSTMLLFVISSYAVILYT